MRSTPRNQGTKQPSNQSRNQIPLERALPRALSVPRRTWASGTHSGARCSASGRWSSWERAWCLALGCPAQKVKWQLTIRNKQKHGYCGRNVQLEFFLIRGEYVDTFHGGGFAYYISDANRIYCALLCPPSVLVTAGIKLRSIFTLTKQNQKHVAPMAASSWTTAVKVLW